MSEKFVSVFLKLFNSPVISKASYINGEYCIPTYYFMRTDFFTKTDLHGLSHTNCCSLMKIVGPF